MKRPKHMSQCTRITIKSHLAFTVIILSILYFKNYMRFIVIQIFKFRFCRYINVPFSIQSTLKDLLQNRINFSIYISSQLSYCNQILNNHHIFKPDLCAATIMLISCFQSLVIRIHRLSPEFKIKYSIFIFISLFLFCWRYEICQNVKYRNRKIENRFQRDLLDPTSHFRHSPVHTSQLADENVLIEVTRR